MGIGDLQQELKKAKEQYKQIELQSVQLEQLTWLNQELLQKLKASEKKPSKFIELHRGNAPDTTGQF